MLTHLLQLSKFNWKHMTTIVLHAGNYWLNQMWIWEYLKKIKQIQALVPQKSKSDLIKKSNRLKVKMSEDWHRTAGTPGTILISQVPHLFLQKHVRWETWLVRFLQVKKLEFKSSQVAGQRTGPYVRGKSNRGAQRGPHPPSPSGSEVPYALLSWTSLSLPKKPFAPSWI